MELWDLYDENYQRTGETWLRGEARRIPEGRYHIVCDVLIRNRDGNYLLTLRDPRKETHPGEWEASAGGSALAGETPEQAARRNPCRRRNGKCWRKPGWPRNPWS